MQWSIIWQGRQYDSKEHCLVHTNDSGIKVDSVIVGQYQEVMYRVEYGLLLDHNWRTLSLKISSIHNHIIQQLDYTSDGNGQWTDNIKQEQVPQLDGCIDVDIPLTPFTNSLPIQRLRLSEGNSEQIPVVYVDLLEQKVSPLHQKYTRLTANKYQYQNVPNDFEAAVTIDSNGFVTDYPQLFVMKGLFKFE